MTAEHLRNSILQMAMTGKLVPQNQNDEPASVLLERIRDKKEQLFRDGKIKKEKNLSFIFRSSDNVIYEKVDNNKPVCIEDELPFEIPETWEWARVKSCCIDVFSGKSPKYSKKETEYKVIGQAANQQNGLDLSQVKYTTKDFWESMEDRYFLKENDVLLNTLGNGTLGRSGIVERIPCPLLTDGHLFVFRTEELISSSFFYYYLQYMRSEIERNANGSTNQTFLSLNKTNNWLVPIPPLSEQLRIVEKIKVLEATLNIYGSVYERVEQLNREFPICLEKSILQWAVQGKLVPQVPSEGTGEELVMQVKAEKDKLIKEGVIKRAKPLPAITDDEILFDIPESWVWVRLSDVIDVRDGTHDTPDYLPSGYPLITGKDFYTGEFDFSKTKYISKKDYEEIRQRSNVQVGDILYSMIGGNIGSMIRITEDNYFEMAIKNVALFKQYTYNNTLTDYLYFFLKSQVNNIQAIAKGGAQSFVPLKTLRSYVFPLPPLAEQKRIVNRLEELFPLIERLES